MSKDASCWFQGSNATSEPCGAGASPGSAEMTTGSWRNGASFVALANFEENSP